jgi:hypothetical protein
MMKDKMMANTEMITFEIQKQTTHHGRTEWSVLEYGKRGDIIKPVIVKTIEDARSELANAKRRNKTSMYPYIDFRIVKKIVSYEVVA